MELREKVDQLPPQPGVYMFQDAGGKIMHAAPNTTSNIFAKAISRAGGRSSYRGLLEVAAFERARASGGGA